MKILFDLTSLDDNFSGIERFALNISKAFIEENKDNSYILVFKNRIHDEFKDISEKENVEIKIINGKNKLITSQIKLPINLYKIKADKYIFLAFPAPVLFHKKGIINAIHDMTAWLYPETMSKQGLLLFKTLIKKAMKNSERIITVSNNSKKDIKAIFPNSKIPIDIIYNGIDEKFLTFDRNDMKLKEIKDKYKINFEYILCLGTLEPRKNINLLIDAYIDLKKNREFKSKLVLVGRKGWKYNSILEKIKENNLEDEIIFTGFVDDDDLPYVYNGAKCFVFPSIYEGFGIPIIEAMSVGVPVIASNTSSIPEVVGENGMLFESNNKEDLKKNLLEFFELDENKIKTLKEKGLSRSREFKWNDEVKKMNYNLKL